MADESWDSIISSAGDSFNRPPEENFEFRIVRAEAVIGKNSPHYEQLKVDAKIVHGPHANKSIKTFYLVKAVGNEKRFAKFLRQLRVLGITTDTLRRENPTMAQIAQAIEERRFTGKVKHNSDAQYGDSADLEWGQMNPPNDEEDEIMEFPSVSAAESLGYGDNSAVAAADDAAF